MTFYPSELLAIIFTWSFLNLQTLHNLLESTNYTCSEIRILLAYCKLEKETDPSNYDKLNLGFTLADPRP